MATDRYRRVRRANRELERFVHNVENSGLSRKAKRDLLYGETAQKLAEQIKDARRQVVTN